MSRESGFTMICPRRTVAAGRLQTVVEPSMGTDPCCELECRTHRQTHAVTNPQPLRLLNFLARQERSFMRVKEVVYRYIELPLQIVQLPAID